MTIVPYLMGANSSASGGSGQIATVAGELISPTVDYTAAFNAPLPAEAADGMLAVVALSMRGECVITPPAGYTSHGRVYSNTTASNERFIETFSGPITAGQTTVNFTSDVSSHFSSMAVAISDATSVIATATDTTELSPVIVTYPAALSVPKDDLKLFFFQTEAKGTGNVYPWRSVSNYSTPSFAPDNLLTYVYVSDENGGPSSPEIRAVHNYSKTATVTVHVGSQGSNLSGYQTTVSPIYFDNTVTGDDYGTMSGVQAGQVEKFIIYAAFVPAARQPTGILWNASGDQARGLFNHYAWVNRLSLRKYNDTDHNFNLGFSFRGPGTTTNGTISSGNTVNDHMGYGIDSLFGSVVHYLFVGDTTIATNDGGKVLSYSERFGDFVVREATGWTGQPMNADYSTFNVGRYTTGTGDLVDLEMLRLAVWYGDNTLPLPDLSHVEVGATGDIQHVMTSTDYQNFFPGTMRGGITDPSVSHSVYGTPFFDIYDANTHMLTTNGASGTTSPHAGTANGGFWTTYGA